MLKFLASGNSGAAAAESRSAALQDRTSAFPPHLTPADVRLLLLLSRPVLSAQQRQLAAALVPQVGHWPGFIDTAQRKFVLPMVYRNLADLQDVALPDEAMASMRDLALRATVEALRRQSAFDWFHQHCTQASGLEHAYFKGPALAARYYPDPMLRLYRDVDLLVPAKAQAYMLRFMLNQGCRAFHFIPSGTEFLDLDSESALRDLLFTTPVPHVMTPQGLVVELHREIDQHTGLFDTQALLDSTIEVPMQRHSIRTLPEPAHTVFICYHHTRHLWSKLHWLADLDAICRHDAFDRSAVLAHAAALKIENTVQAALDLHDLAAAGGHPADFDRPGPGADLLRACVDGLPGDLELEREMRQGQKMNVVGFGWQAAPVSLRRGIWLRLRKLRPAQEDMPDLPKGAPSWLRRALAYWFKARRVASRRMKRGQRR